LAYDGEAKNLVFQRIEWVKLAQLEGFDFLEGDRRLIRGKENSSWENSC
jgi:hypothetical protein